MLCGRVHFKFLCDLPPETVPWDHSFDSEFNEPFWGLLTQRFRCVLMMASDMDYDSIAKAGSSGGEGRQERRSHDGEREQVLICLRGFSEIFEGGKTV